MRLHRRAPKKLLQDTTIHITAVRLQDKTVLCKMGHWRFELNGQDKDGMVVFSINPRTPWRMLSNQKYFELLGAAHNAYHKKALHEKNAAARHDRVA